jgi:hypothetical protein
MEEAKMAKKTIYIRDEAYQKMEDEAQRRGLRIVDIINERLNTSKPIGELSGKVESLHGALERLEKKFEMQEEWSNKMAGLILAKTSFLEELFMLINTENDREERTQAASEAAAKFMETLRR